MEYDYAVVKDNLYQRKFKKKKMHYSVNKIINSENILGKYVNLTTSRSTIIRSHLNSDQTYLQNGIPYNQRVCKICRLFNVGISHSVLLCSGSFFLQSDLKRSILSVQSVVFRLRGSPTSVLVFWKCKKSKCLRPVTVYSADK